MPETTIQKNFFQLNKGLNTESSEVSFPDGFTKDEANYELLKDGSRRRRKGLSRESGGSLKTLTDNISTTQVHRTGKWRNAGGDSSSDFLVHQIGATLYFTVDGETVSTTYRTNSIDLMDHRSNSAASEATVAASAVSMSDGRGHFFVTGKEVLPFYIEYNVGADTMSSIRIPMRIRDFDGIDDGVGISVEPTALSADHHYNLRSRGWIEADITTYNSDQSKYPSKQSLWWKGYQRVLDGAVETGGGVMAWDSAKLDAEQFPNATAPQGALFFDLMDTTVANTAAGGGDPVSISTWSFTTGSESAGGTVTVTTGAVHGRSASDDIFISGTIGLYQRTGDFEILGYTLLRGAHTIVAVPTTTTLTITIAATANFSSWTSQYANLGQVDGGEQLPNSDGKAITVAPTACAYHAGRFCIAGIPDSQWADTLFFSQVGLKPSAYGRFFQKFDPTDGEFNQLASDDGGTIVIPNLGNVKDLLSVRNSLLVFTDRGSWEVGGGNRGFFTADGYSVRQISSEPCSSPFSPVPFDSGAIYGGQQGIIQLAPNEFTRLLEATNLSQSLVQNLWNDIDSDNLAVHKTVHDEALDRIYFLYGDGSETNINQYNVALVLDLRVGAYYKYTFNTSSTAGILDAYTITDTSSANSNKKVKWSAQATNQVDTCDLNQTAYLDYDGAESPLPFMLTGYDSLGDFQRRRQAPIITVHNKKTTTGYTQTGGGWNADNYSSCKMTAYWDWTDDAINGKIGSTNQVYREARPFVPSGANDTDGYPVVTTRNKVRGRGRVLQLKFEGAATNDTHLLGFSVNYKVTRSP